MKVPEKTRRFNRRRRAMGSDMLVALARATVDGHTLLAHSNHRSHGESQALALAPGRTFAPGQTVQATHVEVPQVRQTRTVLGGRSGMQWGYRHGVNERGVAVGVTGIHTRLEREAEGLTGADLVRLALERADSARQALEVLTDLIGRHGQEGEEGSSDNAFVIADGREACVLEACGAHWAEQAVPAVRAVSGVCHLRQDWDRIRAGTAGLAIARGWWPEDGSKLDFAGALGREGPDHASAMRRWVQATLQLEHQLGKISAPLLRRLLGEPAVPAEGEPVSASALVADLSADPADLPLVWCNLGPPGFGVYFPLVPVGELPTAFTDEGGTGSRLWRQLAQWHADPRQRAAVRPGLARLQERFDQNARELAGEARDLRQRNAWEELHRTATSFMQHNFEHFEEFAPGPARRSATLAPPHRWPPREERAEALGSVF
jgi:hypothetical protein